MEKTTAFDLSQALHCWRNELLNTHALRHEDLAELEEHLREAMDDLIGRGLTPEESFLVAGRRLGSAPAITQEFVKINGWPTWRWRIVWMLAGAIGYNVTNGLIGLGSNLTVLAGYHSGVALPMLVSFGRLAGFGLVALALFLARWLVATRREAWRRLAEGLLAHPAWSSVLCVVILVLAQAPTIFGNAWLVRIAGVSEMRQFVVANTYANIANAVLIYLAVPMLMIGLARRHLRTSLW